MKQAINAIKDNENVIQITSSNYGGELGSIKINLKDLWYAYKKKLVKYHV